jgi:hypothetical protein
MSIWNYAQRLRAVRGNRRRVEVAQQLSVVLGRSVGSSEIARWESGARPRAASLIEQWIRMKEPTKPQAQPRPHIGVSFSMFLDTTTKEEADRIAALLLGIVEVIRARWPDEPAFDSAEGAGAQP